MRSKLAIPPCFPGDVLGLGSAEVQALINSYFQCVTVLSSTCSFRLHALRYLVGLHASRYTQFYAVAIAIAVAIATAPNAATAR